MSGVIDIDDPNKWFVRSEYGYVYVRSNACSSHPLIAEFETENAAWDYINKCKEHGIDY